MTQAQREFEDFDEAVSAAKTLAHDTGDYITVWRLGDVETGYYVSGQSPERPCRPSVCVDPDGTEHS